MIAIIYITGMILIPFICWLFLASIEEGGLNEWYDKKILFPLRVRNSKWEQFLGGCDMCFTIWANTIFGTAVTAWWLYANGHTTLVWLFPSYMFLNLGISAMIYKLFKQLK